MDGAKSALLLQHSRDIAQMRVQLDARRFGLIFGEISKPLKLPNWGELVERIAADPAVEGTHILATAGKRVSDASKTQMLFQHFRTKCLLEENVPPTAKLERRIQGKWRRIIHAALYRNAPIEPNELKSKHPYLASLIPVVLRTGMTVNYNYDDSIQQLISL